MPKITHQAEFIHLQELIAKHPQGIAIDALMRALGGTVQRRSLQRRLATLVERGQIEMVGNARSVRYHPVSRARKGLLKEDADQVEQVPAQIYVPLSAEAERIKAYVRQPRHLRSPVGYQLSFLEQYHPNQTPYLSKDLCAQLHAIGRSPAEQTPAGTFARNILNQIAEGN